MKRRLGFLSAALCLLSLPISAFAQTAKPVLDTKIVFTKDGNATVTYNTFGAPAQDAETNKIESALIFYAYTLNKLDASRRTALMGEVQASLNKLATEKGLVRADIIKGVPLIKPLAEEPSKDGIRISFSEIGKQHSLEVTPPDGGGLPLDAAVLFYFQDLTKGLTESGLRLLTLAMGGMNKYYHEKGQPSDPESVSKAPSFALNLAVDILEKLSGNKVN